MSVMHTAGALLVRGLPPTSKYVLLTLALHADSHGRGRLSNEALAYLTSLDTRTIRDHVPRLVKQGYIRREPRKESYQLLFSTDAEIVHQPTS